MLPARRARLERRDEDLFEERRSGEHQRGPHARPPAELRVRLRARHARGANQGRTLRWRPNLGCRRDVRSEEHTSELQSRLHLVCRLLLEKKKKKKETYNTNTQI